MDYLSDRAAKRSAAKGCGRLDAVTMWRPSSENRTWWLACVSPSRNAQRLRPSLQKYPETLFVDVLSVKEHAREALLKHLPAETGVLCTHPMFGPDSAKSGWENLAFVYDKVRVPEDTSDACERFLSLFESAGCRMVEMSCMQHDVYAANSQFLTHLVGRMLGSVGDLRSAHRHEGFPSIWGRRDDV